MLDKLLEVGPTVVNVLRMACAVALASPLILLPREAPASCAPPAISLDRNSVSAGKVVIVRGEGWIDGCDDTGGDSAGGCGNEESEPSAPMQDIPVSLVRGGVPIQETTIDAKENGAFTVRILTEGLTPGTFTVRSEAFGHLLREPLMVTDPG